MAKNKLEFKLYEFSPEIEALQQKISDAIDEDGVWIGDEKMEDVIQEIFNMERAKEEKILSIGKLIKHFDAIAAIHSAHAARHMKREKTFEAQADALREYIKNNTTGKEKYKDAEVSIYPHASAFVIPRTTIEETPAKYRRPSLVPGYDRALADRIEVGCKKQGLESPFKWEHDKALLMEEIREGEKLDPPSESHPGFQHPYATKETSRSIVVR